MEEKECNVCYEKFNKNTRCKLTCPHCLINYCFGCVKTWVMSLEIRPSSPAYCINCKKEWNDAFFANNTPRSFFDGTLSKKRTECELKYEISLLPFTMAQAEIEKNRLIRVDKISILKNEIKELNRLRKEKTTKLNELINFVERKDEDEVDVSIGENDSVGIPCPSEECNGFLNKWKCGICDKNVCKSCGKFKIVGEHTCIESDVLSIKEIKKHTKPCPKCGVRIFNLGGCNHFFCPQCKTGFNWKTLQFLKEGENTNPLYYEYLRSKGMNIRERGDVPCGGLPDYRSFLTRFNCFKVDGMSVDQADMLFTSHHHNIVIEMPVYRVSDNVTYNQDLRIQFILGKMDKKAWFSKLKTSYKQRQKNLEIYQVLESHNMVLNDIINQVTMVQVKNKKKGIDIYEKSITELQQLVISIYELKNYTNKTLDNIRDRFKLMVPVVDEDFKIKKCRVTDGKTVPILEYRRFTRSTRSRTYNYLF